MSCFLLALRLALPVSVPAAAVGTHLTMPDFGVPNFGVAVMRMRWFGRLLRADLMVRVPSAEFLLGYVGVTSFALQSESSAALLLLRADLMVRVPSAEFLLGYTGVTSFTFQSESSAALLWLVLTSRKWSG